MTVCTPNYYKDFVCINSKCTDTCCKCWLVEIDENTQIQYNKAIKDSNYLGEAIEEHIHKGKNCYFKNRIDGSCSFLNEDNLCSLHINFGYDVLPHTCKSFPRFYNTFGLYEEIGLSFSCPTAAKLICNEDDGLMVFDDDRRIESYTDVDAELFYAIKNVRNKIYEFLGNENISLNNKIVSLLNFSKKVQQTIDKKEYDKIDLMELCLTNDELFDFNRIKNKAIRKHLTFKMLRKDWRAILKNALNNKYGITDQEGSIWLKYFVYRYLIKSTNNKKFENIINGAVFSLAVIGCLGFPFVVGAQKYSKEIEHNERNIIKILKIKKIF